MSVQDDVRTRDGYKCLDCGMTHEEHIAKFGRQLEVHRLVPGIVYEPDWCVTLCHDCHTKKPRDLKGVVFGKPRETGLAIIYLSLYEPGSKRAYEQLMSMAIAKNEEFEIVAADLIIDALNAAPPDYCI